MAVIDQFLGKFSKDVGIDLGTANTLVYVKGKGIVINEPSIIALNKRTNQVIAIGKEARKMIGKTPSHIAVSRPLIDGVVSDFETTEMMLNKFIEKVRGESFRAFSRPRVLIGIPSGATEVERKAVVDAAKNAGAREVFLIDEPMAAAIGSRLPIRQAAGNIIVDIGGGTTEIAVISLSGVVVSHSLKMAGDKMSEGVIKFVRTKYNLLLGEKTAEDIKITIGNAYPLEQGLEMVIRGRDLVSGLPKEIVITDDEIREALAGSIRVITNKIKTAIEETPPELVSDIMQKGIILSGGGGMIKGLDKLIAEQTGMKVRKVEDPLTAVVRGTGIVLDDLDNFKEVLVEPEGGSKINS